MGKLIFKLKQNTNSSKIKKFVGTDELRPMLSRVYIDIENKCLVATDAYKMACYPIEIITNELFDKKGINVPPELFNTSAYFPKISITEVQNLEFHVEQKSENEQLIEVLHFGKISVHMCRNLELEGDFPNWKAVFPKQCHVVKEFSGSISVVMQKDLANRQYHLCDPNLLKQMLDCISFTPATLLLIENVTLELSSNPNNKAICFYFYDSIEGQVICKSIIMPKSSI